MYTYSKTDTVILWTTNAEAIRIINELSKELKFKIYEPDKVQDLIAIPCLMKIIDSNHLNDLLVFFDNKADEYFFYDDTKIVICDLLKKNLPSIVKSRVIPFPPNAFSKKLFKTIINEAIKLEKQESQYRLNQYHSRLFRIISIYQIVDDGGNVDIENLCDRFEKSDRTIRREISNLRDIYPKLDICYIKEDCIGSMRAPRKSATIPKTSLNKSAIKHNEFAERVKTIVQLYHILKKGDFINIEVSCKKFVISERTLRRYIKLLREINPDRKISIDKAKGYFVID